MKWMWFLAGAAVGGVSGVGATLLIPKAISSTQLAEKPCTILDRTCGGNGGNAGRGMASAALCLEVIKTIEENGTRNQKKCAVVNRVMDRADEVGLEKAIAEVTAEMEK